MSMGWLDKRWNQDSVRAKRSSVCCSGYNETLYLQKLIIVFLKMAFMYGNDYSSCAHKRTWRVRSCDMASKLRTLSSVAPELASWLILNNTALNFSPEGAQRISQEDPNTSAIKCKHSERGHCSFGHLWILLNKTWENSGNIRKITR